MRKFQLSEDFEIIEADHRAFAISYTIYAQENIANWFPVKMESSFKIYENVNDTFFIRYKGEKIGGAMIRPNNFGLLFLIPPFEDELGLLKKLVLFIDSLSNKNEPITVQCVYPKSYTNFNRLGFLIKETEKNMIRMTEPFNVNWDNDIYLDVPTLENMDKMSELYYEVYSKSNVTCLADKDINFYKELLCDQMEEVEPNYSTLIFDKKTNELIGACMVTIWDEMPYIADIVVKDGYNGRGLGTKMIKNALNNSYGKYFALRLAVRPGNRAEGLYHNLGFIGGIESSEMILKR